MNKIESLIKQLTDLKEELNKNVNMSYGSAPNISKASANPALAPKEVKVKQLKAQVDAGTYKPDAKKIADKMIGKADEDHPVTLSEGDVKKLIKEELTCSANGQWNLNKADKAVAPKAKVKASADEAAVDPVADAAAAPVAAAPVAAAPAPTAGSSGNSPTKTNTETGGSSPGGASTGGVGSGLGGAGTGGAATGGASTGGAGTVTVTISGSSSTDTSTETSSGAGAKKSKGKDKGKGGEPAAPITLNISNVGGRTDAGNVASGDGPGASGSGGHAPGGFGGGGGGASPDEPMNFSTQGKDKPHKDADKNDVFKADKNGQWYLDKSE